jgi:hypothetical protein
VKENTKYYDYLFKGKSVIDEIQPWFDFGTGKPWDEIDIPWVLDNKVRREILIILSTGPKNLKQIHEKTNFSPKALLVDSTQYNPTVKYQWSEATIQNHLMNLEWYNLIKFNDEKYELTFPIFNLKEKNELNEFAFKFAHHWIKIILEMKAEFLKSYNNIKRHPELLEIIIDKAVNTLYELLKAQDLLPNEQNLKVLWAEQIRAIKFEDWVKRAF